MAFANIRSELGVHRSIVVASFPTNEPLHSHDQATAPYAPCPPFTAPFMVTLSIPIRTNHMTSVACWGVGGGGGGNRMSCARSHLLEPAFFSHPPDPCWADTAEASEALFRWKASFIGRGDAHIHPYGAHLQGPYMATMGKLRGTR